MEESEKQRVEARREGTEKWAKVMVELQDQKSTTELYQGRLAAVEKDMNSVVSEFQRKSTETHEALEESILELKAKRQQCELEKFECE